MTEALGTLTLLGAPSFQLRSGGFVRLPSKSYYLFAYLILGVDGFGAARSQIASFLGRNSDPKTASGYLRTLLLRLRAAQDGAGVEIAEITDTHVYLRTDSAAIDLVEAKTLLGSLTWMTLPRLTELFGGDLIEHMAAGVDEEVQNWVSQQREKLRSQFITAAMDLIGGPDAADHPADVKLASRRILELDAYHEGACRALMRAYAAEGQIWEAKRVFERCRAQLAEDLNIGPEAETVDLMQSILGAADGDQKATAAAPRRLSLVEPRISVETRDPAAKAISAGMPKVAILPPVCAGAPQDLCEVADALLHDVNLGLCDQRTIAMVAPHTSWQLGDSGDMDRLAERYGITHFVQSRVNTRDGSNALSVELIDTHSRIILESKRVPLGHLDVAVSYGEICVGLVSALIEAIERGELARYERERNRPAYYYCLLGQHRLRSVDLVSVRRAREAFRQSIKAYDGFAPAFSGLARTLQMEWLLLARGDAPPLDRAEALARRSIDLDPRDSSGYRMLAFSSLYGRRFDEAIAHLSEAERRHPQHADMLAEFADTLAHSGDPVAGLEKLERAMELNPIVPDMYWWWGGGMHYQLQRYREAINWALKMKDPRPAMRLVAACYAQLGEKALAREYVQKTLEVYPDFRVEHWLSIVPNRKPDDVSHYMDGLRAAGFA